jgi:hypothetical protein
VAGRVVMAAVVRFHGGGRLRTGRRRGGRCQLREGNGGGGRVTSGPVRMRWPEVHGCGRCGKWAGSGSLGLCRPGGN